jgi:predicted Fe-Mo cluster-binding NifX family protein
MKIAVTYDNGEIFQHYGHTKQFEVYTISDLKITSSQVTNTNGSGHGALADFLSKLGVDVLICGSISEEAKAALAQKGIVLFDGAQGNTTEAVKGFIDGSLFAKTEAARTGDGPHGCGNCHGCHGC